MYISGETHYRIRNVFCWNWHEGTSLFKVPSLALIRAHPKQKSDDEAYRLVCALLSQWFDLRTLMLPLSFSSTLSTHANQADWMLFFFSNLSSIKIQGTYTCKMWIYWSRSTQKVSPIELVTISPIKHSSIGHGGPLPWPRTVILLSPTTLTVRTPFNHFHLDLSIPISTEISSICVDMDTLYIVLCTTSTPPLRGWKKGWLRSY